MVFMMMDLHLILKSLSNAEYADVRYVRQNEIEVALRPESSDIYESFSKRMVCRAVLGGYGIASTDKLDKDSLKRISKMALKQAKTVKKRIKLTPVKTEEGKVEHKAEKEFDPFETCEFIETLKDNLQSALGNVYSRSEIVISYCRIDSTLSTSDGTNISESTPMIDITLYLIAKRIHQGFLPNNGRLLEIF
jgi:predicted Zn-dependent protease